MVVADVMDPDPVEIPVDATWRTAAELFVEHKSSELIVTRDGAYAGVLSEGDLLRALMPDFEPMTQSVSGVSLQEAYDVFLDSGRFNADRTIGGLVISQPITLEPADPLLKAATVMLAEQIRRMPVLDDGRVVGMLSRSEIARALLARD